MKNLKWCTVLNLFLAVSLNQHVKKLKYPQTVKQGLNSCSVQVNSFPSGLKAYFLFCASTGLVNELRDIQVAQICLGKAHAVVLTTKGAVYTFGINNKGQCGRDFTTHGITPRDG